MRGFRQGSPLPNTFCHAFTLIELLVVIAIIAILAAILLPVLNQAEIRGQMASDLNNFKQLQTCWHMYVLDNNDYLPYNFAGGGSALAHSWVIGNAQADTNYINIQNGVLFQYNQQAKIYACPSNTKLIKVGRNWVIGTPQAHTGPNCGASADLLN